VNVVEGIEENTGGQSNAPLGQGIFRPYITGSRARAKIHSSRETEAQVETLGIILAVLGIALTIFFGIRGLRSMRRNRVTQRQSAQGGSSAIQSGRDTNVNRDE
jgi:hypothetical protein